MNNISIFTTDTNLIIKSWGNWLETITGKTTKNVCGQHLLTIIPEIETRGLLHYFQEVITEGTVKILSPTFHHYLLPCAPITPSTHYDKMQQRVTIAPWWENQIIVGTIVTIEDVTPRLEAEKNKQNIPKNHDQISANIHKLGDENWQIRQENVNQIVRENQEENQLKTLINILKKEHFNPSVLNSILQVLAMSDINAVEPLSELLKDGEADLRIYAALALGEQHQPAAIPPLIAALKDENINVQYHAIDALGKLKAASATAALINIIQTHDFFLAYPAIESLEKIGDRSAASALVPLLTDELLTEPAGKTLIKLADVENMADLAAILNQPNLDSQIIYSICEIIATVYHRYQKLYGEGEQIGNIVAAQINRSGKEQLLKTLDPSQNIDQQNLVLLLTWLENTEPTLIKLLSVPNLRPIIFENLVDKGPKITDLLLQELTLNPDIETQIAIVQCLGLIRDQRAIPKLLDLLTKNETELIIHIAQTLAKMGDIQAAEPLISLLAHSEIRVRQSAIAALYTLGHPQLTERLISLLQNPHPLMRESALYIAGHFKLPETVELILQACEDQNLRVRKAAIETLPHLQHPRILPKLLKCLQSENDHIAASAVKALGYIDSNMAQPHIFAALNHPAQWVRYYAIRALGKHHYPQIIGDLITIAQKDQALPVRAAAIEVISQYGNEEVIELLEPIATTTTEYNDLIRAAIMGLGNIDHPRSQTILLKLIDSKNPLPQRLDAIASLGSQTHPEIPENLQIIAVIEQDQTIIQAVINSLMRLNNSQAIAGLLELTTSNQCREPAITALAQMNLHLHTIGQGLQHPSPIVRESVVEILTRSKPHHSQEIKTKNDILISALSDQNSNIRLAAINALAHITNHQAEAQLAEIAHHDPDISVRRAAFKAIN